MFVSSQIARPWLIIFRAYYGTKTRRLRDEIERDSCPVVFQEGQRIPSHRVKKMNALISSVPSCDLPALSHPIPSRPKMILLVSSVPHHSKYSPPILSRPQPSSRTRSWKCFGHKPELNYQTLFLPHENLVPPPLCRRDGRNYFLFRNKLAGARRVWSRTGPRGDHNGPVYAHRSWITTTNEVSAQNTKSTSVVWNRFLPEKPKRRLEDERPSAKRVPVPFTCLSVLLGAPSRTTYTRLNARNPPARFVHRRRLYVVEKSFCVVFHAILTLHRTHKIYL